MHHLFLVLFLLVFGLACQPPQTDSSDDSPQAQHVIVIGIDGLSPAGLAHANTPHIDQMIEQGASSMRARSVLMTSSSPNWAAMINGVGPEQSGITTNAWGRDNYILPATHLGVEAISPTVFSIIRDQLPKANIACIYHWTGLGRLLETSVMDYHKTWDSEQETAADAARYLQSDQPNFLFVHLDHVDGAGHQSGHETQPYFRSIERADSLVGDILQASESAGIFDQCVFILSSDHGGINYSHGGETVDEMEIPFVVYGKGVKKNHSLMTPVNQFDNPATVLFALGLAAPHSWIGKAVQEAFEGQEVPYLGYERLAAIPQIFPDGGTYIDAIPPIHLSSLTHNATIRYTLDGSEPDSNSPIFDKVLRLTTSATVKAKTFHGENMSSTHTKRFVLLDESADHGVIVRYEPKLNQNRKVFVDTVSTFDLKGLSIIKGDVSYVFSSWLEIDQEGEYIFEVVADNPASLSIGQHTGGTKGHYMSTKDSLLLRLQPGRHAIQLSYSPDAYGRSLQLYFSGPGLPQQKLPVDKLFLSE
ncbi:MAG: alkaline phosphatase family protein [Bacteroidota bacterium]